MQNQSSAIRPASHSAGLTSLLSKRALIWCAVLCIHGVAVGQNQAAPNKSAAREKHGQPNAAGTKSQNSATQAKRGAPKMSDNKLTGGSVTFTVPTGQVVVTPRELEQMRQAVIAYLQQHDAAQHTALLEELKSAHGFIVDNRAGYIGAWRLEQRGQQFRLARYPAERAPITIVPVALLSLRGEHWSVDAWDTERIYARR